MCSFSPGAGTGRRAVVARFGDQDAAAGVAAPGLLMKLPSKATSPISTGIAFSPLSGRLTSRACSGRT